MSDVELREMTFADIPAGLQLCRIANWNQLATDWELILTLNPHGSRVAIDQGKIVGTMTTVTYENRFGWVGMVLVDPECRGKGIGTKLLEESIKILKNIPSVKLDATPQGRPVYLKLGFVDEYGLLRLQLSPLAGKKFPYPSQVRPIGESDIEKITQYDRKAFDAERKTVLRWALKNASEYAWIVENSNGIEGYCLGRHGHNFEQIGPIVASNLATAQQLVMACLSNSEGKKYILDPFLHTPQWIEWLKEIGFVEQRPFTRMYLGENKFPGQPNLQWSILGPELG